jgi:hypothetical protein
MDQDDHWADYRLPLLHHSVFLSYFFYPDLFTTQAQTYAAEAAGVMAENAKMFVAEKMEKVRYPLC